MNQEFTVTSQFSIATGTYYRKWEIQGNTVVLSNPGSATYGMIVSTTISSIKAPQYNDTLPDTTVLYVGQKFYVNPIYNNNNRPCWQKTTKEYIVGGDSVKATLITSVYSTEKDKYPDDGIQGDFWYVNTTPVMPE